MSRFMGAMRAVGSFISSGVLMAIMACVLVAYIVFMAAFCQVVACATFIWLDPSRPPKDPAYLKYYNPPTITRCVVTSYRSWEKDVVKMLQQEP